MLGLAMAPTGRRESDNLILMRRMTATDVARSFSQVLDEVEATGEPVVVVRHGRAVVEICPARSGNGAKLRALLAEAPDDPGWGDELRELRAGEQEDRWSD